MIDKTRDNSNRCCGSSIASGSNYKLQGIALWAGVAAIEMGMLELMGQTANRPLADFFGGTLRANIPVYYASGNRGNTPEAEIDHLQKLVSG